MGRMLHHDSIRILIEDSDPQRRLDAHVTLGERALLRSDVDSARSHFRQAADLDPTDERPRAALLQLEGAASRSPAAPPLSFWRWLMKKRGNA
jgi:predicted ATPase